MPFISNWYLDFVILSYYLLIQHFFYAYEWQLIHKINRFLEIIFTQMNGRTRSRHLIFCFALLMKCFIMNEERQVFVCFFFRFQSVQLSFALAFVWYVLLIVFFFLNKFVEFGFVQPMRTFRPFILALLFSALAIEFAFCSIRYFLILIARLYEIKCDKHVQPGGNYI